MYLAEYYPGITVDEIVENTGFEMNVFKAALTKTQGDTFVPSKLVKTPQEHL
jgi:acyl CoA:acetate/3-ketoacid CoA transferase beta subunit